MKFDDKYWSDRYLNQTTAWDAGAITTPLKNYIDQVTNKHISILIPGCGNSYEAAYLLQNGFSNITLIDISTVLCEKLSTGFAEYLHKGLQIICGDLFEHHALYDLVIEQTFFCALYPFLRNRYATKMHELLKPGGKLVGVLFNKFFEGGPPFGGSKTEYRELFLPYFTIEIMEPCNNSIAPRSGTELFIKMVNKQ